MKFTDKFKNRSTKGKYVNMYEFQLKAQMIRTKYIKEETENMTLIWF